ncbi:MAG: hypothetical protein E4H14_10690, partial [Candidatus Thorarchaeota archaeon]
MPEENQNTQTKVSEADIRRLLAGLDKLEAGIEGGIFRRKKRLESVETTSEENGLSDKDKLMRRKEGLKHLIEVLESEFRESVISEKTYKEAVSKSKQEVMIIETKLREISPSEEQLETGSGGRLLDLEKMKIDMQNQVNDLTLKFSKAEISDEEYNPKVEALKTQIKEIEGEIIRVGHGKSIGETEPKEHKPTDETESGVETPASSEKPSDSGVITQAMEVVEEEKPETSEYEPEKVEPAPEEKSEISSSKKNKSKKKKFSIKSKLFGKKEEEKKENSPLK